MTVFTINLHFKDNLSINKVKLYENTMLKLAELSAI